jgi:hypothetical protein
VDSSAHLARWGPKIRSCPGLDGEYRASLRVMRLSGARSLSPGSCYEKRGELRNPSEHQVLWACGRPGVGTAHTADGRPSLVGDGAPSVPRSRPSADRRQGCPPPVNTPSPTHPQASPASNAHFIVRASRHLQSGSHGCTARLAPSTARVVRTLDVLRSVRDLS